MKEQSPTNLCGMLIKTKIATFFCVRRQKTTTVHLADDVNDDYDYDDDCVRHACVSVSVRSACMSALCVCARLSVSVSVSVSF